MVAGSILGGKLAKFEVRCTKAMRIKSIQLQKVGPFEDQRIDFPGKTDEGAEIHVLVGENGSGKSTVIYGLAAHFGSNELSNKEWANSNLTVPGILKSSTTLSYSSGEELGLSLSWSLDEKLYQKYVNRHSCVPFGVFGYMGTQRLTDKSKVDLNPTEDRPLDKSLFPHNSSFSSELASWVAQTISKSAISARKGDKSAEAKYENEIKLVESTLSSILNEPFRFGFSEEPWSVWAEFRGQQLEFYALPEGLKAILSWLGDLLLRITRVDWENKDLAPHEQNLLVFLDEIDNHLHPAWQRRILPALKKLLPNSQIFVATHSPLVVGSIDGAWIHVLDIVDGLAIPREPFISEDGLSYPAIYASVFGIEDYFGIGAEAKLDEFREMRMQTLKGEKPLESLQALADELSEESREMKSIVNTELRQVERRLAKAS